MKHPFCDRQLPIVADEFVDMEFGTGLEIGILLCSTYFVPFAPQIIYSRVHEILVFCIFGVAVHCAKAFSLVQWLVYLIFTQKAWGLIPGMENFIMIFEIFVPYSQKC